MRFLTLALLACLVAIAAGCEKNPTDRRDLAVTAVATERVFTGQVNESDALIGIAIDDGTITAYLCDGPPGGPADAVTVSTWFSGPLQDDAVSLEAGSGQRLTARFAGGQATGTVTFGGRDYEFTAPGVTGKADLYRGADPAAGEGRRGKIVLRDGTERGTSYPPYAKCRLRAEADAATQPQASVCG
jgi:hypothetical protein